MTTALDIIQAALNELQVYSPEETVSDADAARGLLALNDLIDRFASAYVYVFQVTPFVFSVTAGQSVYIGFGDPGYGFLYGKSAGSFLTGGGGTSLVDVVSALEWVNIWSILPGTGTPYKFYYQATYPNPTYNLAPTPANNGTLTVSQLSRLVSFPMLSTSFVLDYGAEDLLRSNLCMALKPYWNGAILDPLTVMAADQTRKAYALRGLNSRAVPGRNRPMPQPQPGA